MAIVKLGTTKVANRLINYCDKKAQEKDYYNITDPEQIKDELKDTRETWDKNDGIQAHHVIQSFKPDELTPEKANEIGRELAEKIAPGHEAAIYTHADRNHIHNHIVINSVSFENGKKLHLSKADYFKVRELSDNLCREHGLSTIERPYAKERFSMAEYKLAERGEPLWKDELRTAIDKAKTKVSSLEEMKTYLKQTYNIEMKIQNKNISFLHPEKQKYCRGSKLGEAYTKGALENEYDRQAEGPTRIGQPDRTGGRNDQVSQSAAQQPDNSGRELRGIDAEVPGVAKGTDIGDRADQQTYKTVDGQTGRSQRPGEKTPGDTDPRAAESSTGDGQPETGSPERVPAAEPGIKTETQRPAVQAGDREPGERTGGDNDISPVSPLKVIKEMTKSLQREAEKQQQTNESQKETTRIVDLTKDHDRER